MLEAIAGTVLTLLVGAVSFGIGAAIGYSGGAKERCRLQRAIVKARAKAVKVWVKEHGCYECQEKLGD